MINAEDFSKAGKAYIGTPYDTMDCQKFYEQCLKDCGLSMDLKGSNAWYRKFIETGWVGSPEECKAKFGTIPKGATLFIHAYDGGEEKRGYHDGLGNASHIGIRTGTGKGAIHSSYTAGCVAESPFKDKTIRNGGWNTVGLSTLFDYGETINRILKGDASGGEVPPWDDTPENPGEGDEMPKTMTAVVDVPNKSTVNMRAKASQKAALVERVPHGETVEVIEKQANWSKCSWKQWRGWIMNVYLVFDTGEDEPGDETEPMDPGDGFPDDGADVQPGDMVTIQISVENAVHFLTVMELVENQIIEQIGRG